ncbi:MAG TPA: transcription antitermination factor NusB [Xanthobacteraceae bacterium]|nr:transcription antitermination factor NusB [Xanthobacteraceae bacterium]
MAKTSLKERSAARLAAVQALYQMDIASSPLQNVLTEFERHWIGREIEGERYEEAEEKHFRNVVEGVVSEQLTLDPLIDKTLNEGWPLKRVESVLRATLRAGAYELNHRHDIPVRAIVSEYVDVAAAFLDKDDVGMVNAVLDKLARVARPKDFAN